MARDSRRQQVVVMLSVVGVLGLMSLMILHSAGQTLRLSQTAQHVAQQQQARSYIPTVLAALYRFDLSRVVSDPGGNSCYGVDDRSCLCVVREISAADTWRFELWLDEDPDRSLFSGWLRGSPEPTQHVIGVSLGQPAASCLTAS